LTGFVAEPLLFRKMAVMAQNAGCIESRNASCFKSQKKKYVSIMPISHMCKDDTAA